MSRLRRHEYNGDGYLQEDKHALAVEAYTKVGAPLSGARAPRQSLVTNSLRDPRQRLAVTPRPSPPLQSRRRGY